LNFPQKSIFQKESKAMTKTAQQNTQGLNIVFTGNGKGKTTAAMGTVLRAYGQGLTVGVIQFIKSPDRVYGEAATAQMLNIPFQSLGDGFVGEPSGQEDSRMAAIDAWEAAKKMICSQDYDLLILDEITYLFQLRWLKVNEFIAWIKQNKPASMHLVMTGRYAPLKLIEFADLVTEMHEIKHPFREQGIQAQIGIDY
jgi:cob(I)alamin adenosyltransferase